MEGRTLSLYGASAAAALHGVAAVCSRVLRAPYFRSLVLLSCAALLALVLWDDDTDRCVPCGAIEGLALVAFAADVAAHTLACVPPPPRPPPARPSAQTRARSRAAHALACSAAAVLFIRLI